jgi:hypothetical protein
LPRLQALAVDRPGRVQWREDAIAGPLTRISLYEKLAGGMGRECVSTTTQRAERATAPGVGLKGAGAAVP